MATEETKVHLLPTDPAQDRILEEFLNKFKHQSAIDHIEKRLKKARSDHVVRLNVMRALITIQRDRLAYFNHVAAKYLGPSITALADIAAQTVTDLACLEAVDESGRGSWIGQYWQKAAELHPDYEDVFDIWFDTQFRKQQYDEAAKAVVSWRKYFPSKAPELSWRLILCYHLATTSPHVGERQKSMCGMLRDKLLEQAVDNTPSRNEKVRFSSLVKTMTGTLAPCQRSSSCFTPLTSFACQFACCLYLQYSCATMYTHHRTPWNGAYCLLSASKPADKPTNVATRELGVSREHRWRL